MSFMGVILRGAGLQRERGILNRSADFLWGYVQLELSSGDEYRFLRGSLPVGGVTIFATEIVFREMTTRTPPRRD